MHPLHEAIKRKMAHKHPDLEDEEGMMLHHPELAEDEPHDMSGDESPQSQIGSSEHKAEMHKRALLSQEHGGPDEMEGHDDRHGMVHPSEISDEKDHESGHPDAMPEDGSMMGHHSPEHHVEHGMELYKRAFGHDPDEDDSGDGRSLSSKMRQNAAKMYGAGSKR